MPPIPAAFPFIEVKIDTSALTPVAQRSPGVIAIVGKSTAGDAAANKPFAIDTLDQAAGLFAAKNRDGTVTETPLYSSLKIAILQDPKPSKIYGVKVDADNYAGALASLEAADDVTFVSLANEVSVGTATVTATGVAATNLVALKEHVETMSAQGQKRIGVAMVDPTTAKSGTYVDSISTAINSLKSDSSRMVVIAARGATEDAATAAMAAIAGFDPQVSMVLKKVRGFSMPVESQYSPSEIKGLSEAGIIPIIDPALIVGESLHFAEGRCFTTDASLLYIDIVRVLDDIDFRLKAGLIGAIGDARITKSGMTMLKTRVEGILGPLQRSGVIVNYNIDIPVLNILSLPESSWTVTDQAIVQTARANRIVDLFVTVTYGPAVHQLKVTLAPKF
ncbi:hypothetical protein IQ273_12295 [Nodosilinea sp. LEGE 07298]|uniref:hypothetical protein n=1 Tax=Nodosilinea sp. LEGE 07298 TaxID=2777970 RepID=UPI00187F61DE|nr:hypothetical protein [Nodosilinea sp. LEGE 07298]MBE9110192.1 hypothetical protein [Nodosilinea sp. LEGE 07298]